MRQNTDVKITDYLRGWVAAAAVYAFTQLVIGLLLTRVLENQTLPSAVRAASTAPWLVPAVLSVIAALVAVRRKVTAEWWKWLAVTMVVPTVGGAVIVSWAANHSVDAASILPDVITHVAVAGVLGVTTGSVLNVVRRTVSRGR